MTDRYSGFVVVLDENIREDDAEATLNAIRQIRGVQSVKPVVAEFEAQIAEARAKSEILEALIDLVKRRWP